MIKITVFAEPWVYVGDTTIEDGYYVIRGGANIRQCGTSRGLGELFYGPTPQTKLDKVPGALRIPVGKMTAGGERDCHQEVWEKVLAELVLDSQPSGGSIDIGGEQVAEAASHPYKIGAPYLIRTVTHYYTGRLVAVHQQELLLEDAAWIADTGRYHKALETGEVSEVEPIKGQCIVGRGAIIDAVDWPNSIALPRTPK